MRAKHALGCSKEGKGAGGKPQVVPQAACKQVATRKQDSIVGLHRDAPTFPAARFAAGTRQRPPASVSLGQRQLPERTARSRVPLIGLARLQRALEGSPPSFDPIHGEVGRHGNGPPGDRDGPCVKRKRERRLAAPTPPRGCRRRYNLCPRRGLHAARVTWSSRRGESWSRCHCMAQAVQVAG